MVRYKIVTNIVRIAIRRTKGFIDKENVVLCLDHSMKTITV